MIKKGKSHLNPFLMVLPFFLVKLYPLPILYSLGGCLFFFLYFSFQSTVSSNWYHDDIWKTHLEIIWFDTFGFAYIQWIFCACELDFKQRNKIGNNQVQRVSGQFFAVNSSRDNSLRGKFFVRIIHHHTIIRKTINRVVNSSRRH